HELGEQYAAGRVLLPRVRLPAVVAERHADGIVVAIGHALPARDPGMPGAGLIRDELVDLPVAADDVVVAHLGARIRAPRDVAFVRLACGPVDHDQVRLRARWPRAMVRRWPFDDRHGHFPPGSGSRFASTA